MKKLQFIVRYWRVGKLLHIVSFIAACIAGMTFSVLWDLHFESNPLLWFTWLIIFISFLNMSVLAQLDSFSRFQNYKQVKDQIFLNGFQLRMLKPLAKSSCQREAAILAGIELGYDKAIRNYFYKLGYRWYHVIPDFVLNDPLFFFTRLFWKTTFFAPYYPPKINYELKVTV